MTETDEARISDEAAKWVKRIDCDGELAAKCRAEFAAWLRRSPVHIRAFLCISAVFSLLDDKASQPH